MAEKLKSGLTKCTHHSIQTQCASIKVGWQLGINGVLGSSQNYLPVTYVEAVSFSMVEYGNQSTQEKVSTVNKQTEQVFHSEISQVGLKPRCSNVLKFQSQFFQYPEKATNLQQANGQTFSNQDVS